MAPTSSSKSKPPSPEFHVEPQELVAEARGVIVMLDFRRNAKHPLPALFRERIEALEGRPLTAAAVPKS